MTVDPFMVRIGNNLLAVVIIFFFFFIIYASVRKRTLAETLAQIKELFGGDD